MTSGPEEHPEARAEYVDAVAFYEELRAGLGNVLIERFERAVNDIISDPALWSQVAEWSEEPVLRGHRVTTFPYRLVYYVRHEQVRIVTYAHTSRRPGYWKHRVQD